jgi:cytochrome bd-type quinol oxidase subunit 2
MPNLPRSPKPDPMAREVDRLLAGLNSRGAQTEGDHPSRADAVTRRDLIALWARLFLGVALGGMITQWPYVHACGLPLLEYFGAVTVVMVAGAWIAVASWSRRYAPSHVLALLLILWGIALAAYEILPRVGYAAQRWTWQC